MCLYTHTYLYVGMCTTPWMDRQMQLKPWFSLIFPFHITITSPCTAFHFPLFQLYFTWLIMIVFTLVPILPHCPFQTLHWASQPNLCSFVHHIPQLLHKSLSFFSLLIPEHFFSCLIEWRWQSPPQPAVRMAAGTQSWCWAQVTPPRAVVPSWPRTGSSSTPVPCHLSQLSGTCRVGCVPPPLPWAKPHPSTCMLPSAVRHRNAREWRQQKRE